ncbi:ABC transporter permease [Micromonospora sp. NPDC001898]|uniref:ABC transporter permease n=1 Tax=Micromonospora sp. NPDC001898 TaxID=3364221 RepID=UPI0036AD28F6
MSVSTRTARPAVVRRPGGAPRLRRALTIVGGFVAVVALWWLAASFYGMPMLFPGPPDVVTQFKSVLADGSLAQAVSASLGRVAAGLVLGSLLGTLLGLLSGSSRVLEALLEPFISFFRFIPPLAWFAPVLLWLGAGEPAKLTLILYTTVFVVAVNTAAGVRAVPGNKLRMAATFGARPWQTFLLVRLPGSAAYILAGIRIALGNAFMTVVTAEMLGAPSGLGVIVTNGMATTNIRGVFVALITLGALGLIADRLFVALLRRFGARFGASPDVAR